MNIGWNQIIKCTICLAPPAPATSFLTASLPLPQQSLYEEDAPIEEVRVIPDFLPPPEELTFCREGVGE